MLSSRQKVSDSRQKVSDSRQKVLEEDRLVTAQRQRIQHKHLAERYGTSITSKDTTQAARRKIRPKHQ